LTKAKAAAPDPTNPKSVLDALADSLPADAKAGLAKFRSSAPDATVLKAIESTSTRGLDISSFLTEKALTPEAKAAVRGEVLSAHARLVRLKLIELEAIKDPALRKTATDYLVDSIKLKLEEYGILKDPKVDQAVKTGDVQKVVGDLGEAISRADVARQYPASRGYEVLGNIELVREVPGFKRIAEWKAAEQAAGRPGDVGGLYEQGGKLWKSITELDTLVGERTRSGALRPIEIEQVKTGKLDTAPSAQQQVAKAANALAEIVAGAKDVRIFERSAKNTLGKDLTSTLDLSNLSQLKGSTRGLPSKPGFTRSVLYPRELLEAVARTLVQPGGLPPTKPATPRPPTSPRKEEEPEKQPVPAR
jgi:hypothetical protein